MTFSKKIFSFGVAQLIDRLISFILVPTLLFFITLEEYAIWSQIIIVVGIVAPILHLGMPQALIKYLPIVEKRSDEFFLCVLITYVPFILLVSFFIILFTNFFTFLIFANHELDTYLFPIVVLVICETLYEIIGAKLRYSEKIKLLSILLIIKSCNRLLSICLAILLSGGSLVFAVYLYGFTSALLIAHMSINYVKIRVDTAILWEIMERDMSKYLRISLPFVPVAITVGGSNFSDRFLITHFLGLDKLGEYAAVYSIASVISVVYSTIGFVIFPIISKTWHRSSASERENLISRMLDYYLFFFIPFSVGVTFLGPEVVTYLTNEKVLASNLLAGGLALSIGLFGLGQLLSYAVIVEYSSSKLLRIYVLSVTVNFTLNILLIPRLGLVGAMIAGVVCNSVVIIWLYKVLSSCSDFKIKQNLLFDALSILTFVGSVLLLLQYLWPAQTLFVLVNKILFVMASYFFVYNKKLRAMGFDGSH